jgi:hypothetical protein
MWCNVFMHNIKCSYVSFYNACVSVRWFDWSFLFSLNDWYAVDSIYNDHLNSVYFVNCSLCFNGIFSPPPVPWQCHGVHDVTAVSSPRSAGSSADGFRGRVTWRAHYWLLIFDWYTHYRGWSSKIYCITKIMFEQLIYPSINYCLHLFSTKTLIKATAVCVYLQTQCNTFRQYRLCVASACTFY